MAAVARACEAYGRFGAAGRLLEAAGAWAELLALCTFQGDFLAMQAYAREVRAAYLSSLSSFRPSTADIRS
jgi:hypothetical protein